MAQSLPNEALAIGHLPSFSDGRRKMTVPNRRKQTIATSRPSLEMKTNTEYGDDHAHEVIHEVDLRIALLGSSGAGKSCLALRFVRDSWVEGWPATIEDCYNKSLEIVLGLEHGSRRAVSHFTLFDTSGDEEYADLRPSWMHDKDGYLLVFSLANKQSLETAKEYQSLYEEHCKTLIETYREHRAAHPTDDDDPPRLPFIFVVGTKKDVVDKDPDQRVITSQEGHRWAEQIGAEYFEISAKTCEGVVPVFARMAKICREPDESSMHTQTLGEILSPSPYQDDNASPAEQATSDSFPRRRTSSGNGRSNRLKSASFSESDKVFADPNERRPRNWLCAAFCSCLCCCLRRYPAHRMRQDDRSSMSSTASTDELCSDVHSAGRTNVYETPPKSGKAIHPTGHPTGRLPSLAEEDDASPVHASDVSMSLTTSIHIVRRASSDILSEDNSFS